MRMILPIVTLCMVSPLWAEPRLLTHRYGVTEIEGSPQRVVSLSFIGHDFLLALGVRPIALRYWYGSGEHGVFPWAEAALGDAEPLVLYGDIDIEQIALLQPDLIVGQWSGMTETQYQLLSKIAPTLPPAKGELDYSSSWQSMTRQLGLALDLSDKAEDVINRLETRFEDVRAAHPEWIGKTTVVAWPARIGAYTSVDLRSRFMSDLGFAPPTTVDQMISTNAFYVMVPQEDLTPIDVDVLVWTDTVDLPQALDNIVLRKAMRAYREGRELYADYDLTAALSHSSPLSLDYALDRMVPLIEAAVDGDPTTLVETTAAEGVAPRHDPKTFFPDRHTAGYGRYRHVTCNALALVWCARVGLGHGLAGTCCL